jgi:hypothetical protein
MKDKVKIINDVNRALVVMNQTSSWAYDKGIKLPKSWDKDRLTPAGIVKTYGAKPGEFFVLEIDGMDAGAFILMDRPADRAWDKYGYADKHYYVYKLAVADGFHGGRAFRQMMDTIKEKAVLDNVKSIRADADIKIAPIYINNGFFPHWSFKGGKTGKVYVRLAWYRWTPDEFETIWRGVGKFNLRRFTYLMIKKILWFL